jgi:hypothetical protein
VACGFVDNEGFPKSNPGLATLILTPASTATLLCDTRSFLTPASSTNNHDYFISLSSVRAAHSGKPFIARSTAFRVQNILRLQQYPTLYVHIGRPHAALQAPPIDLQCGVSLEFLLLRAFVYIALLCSFGRLDKEVPARLCQA